MAFETRFDISPYFDDFDKANQFLKVLFRPGFAVQTRELNQMQTIINNQISAIGDHIFENGSVVYGGQVSLRTDYTFVKLESQFVDDQGNTLSTIGSNVTDLIGQNITIRNSPLQLKARVVNATEPSNIDPPTIFVEYQSSDDQRPDGTFDQGDQLQFDNYASDVVVSETGVGSAAEVEAGVYYVDGYFHFVPSQTIILDKYTNTPTYAVGLFIKSDLVTPNDDPSLLDNAGGSPNFGAPGAHRFRVQLQLEKRDLEDVDNGILFNGDDFVQVLRVRQGNIQQVARTSSYNVLDNKLATRTYDESGNYVITPFPLSKRPHLNTGSNNGVFTAAEGGSEDKFAALVDGGKAYVYGYRIQKPGTTILEHDKARTSDHIVSVSNTTQPVELGNWAVIEFPAGFAEYPLIGQQIAIRDSYITGVGSDIGTCRIRHLDVYERFTNSPNHFRAFLYDIRMNSGKSFTGDAKSLWTLGNNAIADFVNDPVILNNQETNRFVFNLPEQVVQSVTSIQYTITRTLSGQSNETDSVNDLGEVTFQVSSSSFFRQPFVLFDIDAGEAYDIGDPNTSITIVSGGFGFSTVTFGDVNSNNNFILSAPVQHNTSGARTKTLQQDFAEALDAQANNIRAQQTTLLAQPDVIRIKRIVTLDDNNNEITDVTDAFDFDNGQRDNIYDFARITLRSGQSVPQDGSSTDNIKVVYDYFEHSLGDYFVVDSYDGVDLDEIPTYTTSAGEDIRLFEAIDFRPTINDSASFIGHATPDTIINTSLDFFVGRVDNVILNTKSEIQVQRGVPNRDPQAPSNKTDSIILHRVSVPPYTFEIDEIDVTTLEHRHFTMTDIANIEDRVTDLEEEVILNKLEQDTDTRSVNPNNANQARFKNGFIVDPFFDHTVADIDADDYAIAVDFENQEARPQPFTETLPLDVIDANSLNTIKRHKNGIITLPYEEQIAIAQPQASSTVSVNPFLAFHWRGSIELDPQTDNWFDTRRLPDVVNTRVIETRAWQEAERTNSFGTEWNNWETQWFGTFDLWRGRTRTGVRREAVTRVRERVNDRVVSRQAIPFIRQNVVDVSAKGLRPNSTHYAFFDGVDVTDFVNQLSTPPPSGNALRTDNNGELEAEFTIPNNDNLRFRTGTREFVLVDDNELTDNPISQASADYQAEGTLRTRQATIESVRVRDVETSTVTETIDLRNNFIDPIAQTFMIDQNNGQFITGVDVAFTQKDDVKPVKCVIVATENGIPTSETVPMAESVLNPSEVTADPNNITWTTFAFPAPVYLQEGTEYAFIVVSTSEVYRIRYAQMGERDLRTGAGIAKQPASGVMLKSANSSTWQSQQQSDVTFRLRSAKFTASEATFDASINVPSKNVGTERDPFKQALRENPIQTRDGSQWIMVEQPNHGFVDGDTTTLSGIIGNEAGGVELNGFRVNEGLNVNFWLNGSHTVRFPQKDFYFIESPPTQTANSSGRAGGSDVLADKQFPFDVLFPVAEQQTPGATEVSWKFRAKDQVNRTPQTEQSININENTNVSQTLVVQENQDTTAKLVGKLRSQQAHLSPTVDAQRLGMTVTRNRINDTTAFETLQTNQTGPYADYELFVPETSPNSSALAKYLTRVIRLANTSNSLQVLVDINQPVEYGRIRAFYRLQLPDDDGPLAKKPWQELPRETPQRVSSNPDQFFEISFDSSELPDSEWVSGPNTASPQELPDYQALQIKLVWDYDNSPTGGTDTTQVPRVRRFRALALTT